MSIDTTRPTNTTGTDARQEVVVKCPATGQIVGSVPVATADEVEAVAARLRAAQPGWQQMGVDARARWLGKWRDWMLDHRDELLTPLQLETGKSWGDTGVLRSNLAGDEGARCCRGDREGQRLPVGVGRQRMDPG